MLAVCLYVQCTALSALLYTHFERTFMLKLLLLGAYAVVVVVFLFMNLSMAWQTLFLHSSFSIHEPNKCFLCLHLYRIYTGIHIEKCVSFVSVIFYFYHFISTLYTETNFVLKKM